MRDILLGPSNCHIKVRLRMFPQVHASLLNWVFPRPLSMQIPRRQSRIFSPSEWPGGHFQISDILALMPYIPAIWLSASSSLPQGAQASCLYFWSMFSPKALPDRALNWIPSINMSHLCGGAVVLVRGGGAPRGAVVTTGVLHCRRRSVGENRGGG